jgi:hypothetical protein
LAFFICSVSPEIPCRAVGNGNFHLALPGSTQAVKKCAATCS